MGFVRSGGTPLLRIEENRVTVIHLPTDILQNRPFHCSYMINDDFMNFEGFSRDRTSERSSMDDSESAVLHTKSEPPVPAVMTDVPLF